MPDPDMITGKLHVVLSDFNGWNQTRICLEALSSSRHGNLEIILVDHGTSEETARGVARCFPHVIRIEGSSDLWWAGATNLGVLTALDRGAQSIMLLNNDCYVSAETIRRLLAMTKLRHDVIIAPVQRRLSDGRLLTNFATSSFTLGFPTLSFPIAKWLVGQERLLRTGLIIGGRGVIVPAAVFRDVGLFNDKQLPHYGADHDFFLRCRRRGIRLYLALNAFVDIDDTRTTLAGDLGRMTAAQFIRSLSVRRSHRNLRDLTTLFRLHYPLPGLYYVGIGLNLARYALTYIAYRLAAATRQGLRRILQKKC